jgi:hypothetical protein
VWPSWPQACITPGGGWPRRRPGLGDGQRVHVGAQAQPARAAAAHQRADDTRAADAALDRVAPAHQLLGHQRRRAVLVEGQFGVAVDVAPHADEGGRAFLHRAEQGVHGHRGAHCGCRLIC